MATEVKTKLKRLTKEEKLELLQALEQKEKLEKKRRNKFTPHGGQLRVLKSRAPIKLLTCGNGWGKSTFAVNLLHARATGVDPWNNATTKVPSKIVVLLDNPSKIGEVYRTEYNKWHDADQLTELRHGSPYVKEWQFKNGSSVRFLTQDMDQLTFESIQFDVLIIDEICPRAQYIGLTRGQRAKNVAFEQYIIGTPISNDHAWVRQDLIQPWLEGKRPDLECFTGGTADNAANLGKGYLERFESLLTEKERRVRMFGEFSSVDGLAFGHLINDTLHMLNERALEWQGSWPVVVGIDPHPSKAHVAVMVGRRPGDDKLFVIKELSAKQTAREFATSLLNWVAGYRVVEWICDSLGSAESTGHEGFKSFIDVLKDCGVRARATTFNDKSHEDAVERIRDMLALEESAAPHAIVEKTPRLRFIEFGAPKAYRELKNIAWVYDKKRELNKPKLDSAKLDYYSALTYALSSTYLAKTMGDYGRISTGPSAAAGVGRSIAQGLGITTSKKSSVANQPMRRYYTRNAFSRDDD